MNKNTELKLGSVARWPGWALPYIQSEHLIPEEWRSAFYDELVSDDLEYRKSLEESIRQHGVRWV